MTKLNFEGDLEEISEFQLNFIAGVLEDHGFTNEKVTIEPLGKAGDNYVANVKRIKVEKDGKNFRIVAKVAPRKGFLRESMNTPQLFHNEHYMYTKVLPKFSELEEAANVPKSERLRYAECYGSTVEPPNEIILLEDLNMSEYIILDRLVSLNNDTVKMTLRSFAILHSLSYLLKHQEPETFEEFSKNLLNMYEHLMHVEPMQVFLKNLENDVLCILENDVHKNLVKGTVSQLVTLTTENLKIDRELKSSVIQQGDPWTNNIMFRLQDGKPVECCMIDYQLSNNHSPVGDLEYMIFNCTDHETRSKYYYQWIDYYHSELEKRLAHFGLKIDEIYPRKQLDEELRRHGKQFFGVSIMLANILMREVKEAAKFKEAIANDFNMDEVVDVMAVGKMEQSTMTRFKDRIEGLIKSFVDFGYLEHTNCQES